MVDEPKTLKSLYTQAEQKRKSLEGALDTTWDSYRDTVSSAIQAYQECLELISKLSIFSPNESAEDISTSDLPYLLVSYRLSGLVQKLPSPSPSGRKQILARARGALEKFLHLLDNYSLLSSPHARLLQRYGDDPAAFSTINTTDPNARRNAKIETFRAEKELRQKLESLQSRPEYGAGGDEEAVRKVHLANLSFCAHNAFQALEGINREMEVLAMAPPEPQSPAAQSQQEDDDARHRGRGADGYSERLEGPVAGLRPGGPLLSKQGKPMQPFTLLNDRQELRKGVFRPGHNLPTMTIDEYLDEEWRRGGIIEGGGEASMRTAEPDEDDEEKADAATMKARAWDEFTEANPKGAGNTLNRG